MTENQESEMDRIIERFLEELGEHCDAVQVMASWNEEGRTYATVVGSGNWYARQGMARQFINTDQAQTNAREISEAINPTDPE